MYQGINQQYLRRKSRSRWQRTLAPKMLDMADWITKHVEAQVSLKRRQVKVVARKFRLIVNS